MQDEAIDAEDEDRGISLVEALTWIGESRRFVALFTAGCTLLAVLTALLLTPVYTARLTMMPPGTPPSGSAAALASINAIAGLSGGLGTKTVEDLYVALLKSDSVVRALDEGFGLKARYDVKNYEALRRAVPRYIRVAADRKSGVLNVEVDDEDPKFAADLANAHLAEATRLLGRLAVSEARQRRLFFEAQVLATKDNLVKAETALRKVQETSGVVALDRQAEAVIAGAARARALLAEREVQLRVLRTSATEQNPDVQRLGSEIAGLRTELARLETAGSGQGGTASALAVGRIPAAAVDYVRATRELRLQESLLEAMVRQLELARLDEAREGPPLQLIDKALPPDYKSKPARALIVLGVAAISMLLAAAGVVVRARTLQQRQLDPERQRAWDRLRGAWRRHA